jgi:hypothetical protein
MPIRDEADSEMGTLDISMPNSLHLENVSSCEGSPSIEFASSYEWGEIDSGLGTALHVDDGFPNNSLISVAGLETAAAAHDSFDLEVVPGLNHSAETGLHTPHQTTDTRTIGSEATPTYVDGQNGGVSGSNRSLSAPFSLKFQPKSILEPADHFAQLIARSLAATAAESHREPTPYPARDKKQLRLYPGMFSLSEVARLVGEYPVRMLQPTFSSPFIHPELCRQRPGGPPAPLAVAFACVSMKLHMEKEGEDFVCETMSNERDKLIKRLVSFRPHNNDPVRDI